MYDANLILDEFLNLQKKYSLTFRSTLSLSRYSYFENLNKVLEKDILNSDFRESLTEHVGHLPIAASFLHPFIEHSSQVDLGKSLLMLSIHDIAETETGDVNAFAKTSDQSKNEEEIAKKLLHRNYLEIYEEYESCESFESKFAQSIDKLSPLLIEMCQMKIVPMKMTIYPYSVEKIKAKQFPKHEWDAFLSEFAKVAVERFGNELLNQNYI